MSKQYINKVNDLTRDFIELPSTIISLLIKFLINNKHSSKMKLLIAIKLLKKETIILKQSDDIHKQNIATAINTIIKELYSK